MRPETGPASNWFECWRPLPNARLQLFCLPHAGGGAYAYRTWADRLAPEVEVVAIRPPGRERRYAEPPMTRLDDLVPRIVRNITPWLNRPHAYFGHSMGALIAFEICRTVRHVGLAEPVRLLVSGTPAPHLPGRGQPVHDAPTEMFVERLRELNGTPPEVLNDPTALSALLPTLRADWTVAETYHYRPEPPLSCPLSVFGGTDDPQATADELREWRCHTIGHCIIRQFPGDHFFINSKRDELLKAIAADLTPLSELGSSGPGRNHES